MLTDEQVRQVVEARQYLHQHPEPGYHEHETAAYCRSFLQETVGIPADMFFNHEEPGFYVDVWGTGSEAVVGRKLILRTEQDALRMTEDNPDLPYQSVNSEFCHACGHDGHMATLMAAGWLIWQHRSKVPSNCLVRLLFQPAEEGLGGAVPTIEHGVLEGIDEIYAYHNTPEEELGKIY